MGIRSEGRVRFHRVISQVGMGIRGVGLALVLMGPLGALGQQEAPPVVGRSAGEKYMGETPAGGASAAAGPVAPRDHYLALHVGGFVSSTGYEWGAKGRQKDPGQSTFGVTYRMGEWVNTLDLLFRADFATYDLAQGDPFKMTLMPIVAFPDSASRFPLYFGAGIGPGIFFDQIQDESAVVLEYQLLAGLRFFNLYKTAGVMIETGVKNHLHLISDGQFNGVFVSMGGVFAF